MLGVMVLHLNKKDFLRLRGARGVAIEVVGGRVWITEDGHPADRFLATGGRYLVGGDGLVLVGAENDETALRLVAVGLLRSSKPRTLAAPMPIRRRVTYWLSCPLSIVCNDSELGGVIHENA